ncbi:MAG: glycerol-3-phosphate acyltransferase, partial [Hydrogenovibrio sp.]|nr:glycerol-3-phosphate acyltransferase [Hydrogenovibrio sp.]
IAKVLKISSISALVATALAPIYIYFLSGEWAWVIGTALMTALLYWRHRGNIQRLIQGVEH